MLSGAPVAQQRSTVQDRPRVLLADDHELMRKRVKAILDPEFNVVGAVENGQALVDATALLNPNVLVVDISMPVLNGIEAIRQIKKAGSIAKVVFLTVDEDSDTVAICREVGALAYVVKAHLASDLISAIRLALIDRTFVSPIVPWHN